MPLVVIGSIEKVKEVIKKEKSQKVVVFSDEGIKATGLLGILTARLDETGVQYHVFTDCKPEPTYGQVEAVVDMAAGTGMRSDHRTWRRFCYGCCKAC